MKKIVSFILIVALLGTVPEAGIQCFAGEEANTENDNSNFTNLIVFTRFSGEEEFIDQYYEKTSVRKITDDSYNTAEYSVADYYRKVSGNKLRMKSVYLFDGDGSLQLTHDRAYYAEYSEENPEGYQGESERWLRMNELKQEWADAISHAIAQGNQISNYDGTEKYSLEDLDKNGDGIIDAITIIFKNTTQKNISVGWASPLWNYQDTCNYVSINTGKRTLTSNKYVQLTNTYANAEGNTVGYLYRDENGTTVYSLATTIHETGHILGLKDLYNSSNVSPVYYMSVMAKPISPIPQFLSVKEREALGWLENGELINLSTDGTYQLRAVGTDKTEGSIGCAYKMQIPEKGKTLYLEYRNFSEEGNPYDSQMKNFYKSNGKRVDSLPLKSGLICYLVDSDTNFPNNMNYSGPRWNYEVLGGSYGTKVDAAVGENEELWITEKLWLEVISIDGTELTFKLHGCNTEHRHTGGEATCVNRAVCTECHQEYGELDKNNHKNTEIRNRKEATTVNTGYSGDTYCIDCGSKIASGKILPLIEPSITEGMNTSIDITAGKTLEFRSNAALSDFLYVELDGKQLINGSDYSVTGDGIRVILTKEKVAALTAGEHEIEIVSVGGSAGTKFTAVKPTEPAKPIEPPVDSGLTSAEIYIWQYENGKIEGGAVVNDSAVAGELMYRWQIYDINQEQWILASDWSKDYGIHYYPDRSGDYLVYCEVKDSFGNYANATVGVNYRHAIQAICQMPDPNGNGYLIGIQSFDNPGYSYEMLILDCNLYIQGKDAWIYSTGRCGATGNTLWTTWNPTPGYYWTLYRVYDVNGTLMDQQCYGFTS